jgi:hypothetical protein
VQTLAETFILHRHPYYNDHVAFMLLLGRHHAVQLCAQGPGLVRELIDRMPFAGSRALDDLFGDNPPWTRYQAAAKVESMANLLLELCSSSRSTAATAAAAAEVNLVRALCLLGTFVHAHQQRTDRPGADDDDNEVCEAEMVDEAEMTDALMALDPDLRAKVVAAVRAVLDVTAASDDGGGGTQEGLGLVREQAKRRFADWLAQLTERNPGRRIVVAGLVRAVIRTRSSATLSAAGGRLHPLLLVLGLVEEEAAPANLTDCA